MADENIKWVTINGARVPIKEGETPEEALAKLSEKPKRENVYLVKRGTVKFVVKESDLDKYRSGWEYDIQGEDMFEKLNLDKELDFIENMDYSQNNRMIDSKLRQQFMTLPRDIRDYLYRETHKRVAEYQQSLADDYLADAPKSKDAMLEDSVLSVNKSHYDESKAVEDKHSPEYAAYTYNCQRCAQSFILRWCYGYDVTAKPCERVWDEKKKEFELTGVDQQLHNYAHDNGYDVGPYGVGHSNYNGWHAVIFNTYDVYKSLRNGDDIAQEIGYSGTEDQFRWIKRTVKAAGPGAAYLCSVCWKGTRDYEGYYDAHVFCIVNDKGKVKCVDPQTGEECSRYFTDKQIVPKKTEIFRADNCRLNGTMMKEVCEYDK